jgi:tetratricopeptide (TPR) repeat protein
VREADALIAVSVLSFVVLSWFVLRRKRAVSFYILWFFVTLAPVCNIVPINAIMAERFLYLPMIGFASLFAMFFSRLMDRSRHNSFFGAAAISVLAAILILYGFAAISRNFEWRRPLVFYAKEVERSPSNPIAHNNLGLVYAKEAREGGIPDGMRAAYRALAEAQYKEAMALDGAYAAPARNLANLCREAGRHSLAIENFKKAVSMEDDAVSYNNMAVSYYCLGEFDETIPACKKALALRPDYADAYINLGNAFFMKGDYRRAKAAWSAAARLGGATPEALEGIKDLALKGY